MKEEQEHGSVSKAIDSGVTFAGKILERLMYLVCIIIVVSFVVSLFLKVLGLG